MMNHILLCNCLCIAWILPKITCIHGVFRVRANTCDYWFLMKGSTAPPSYGQGQLWALLATYKFVYWVNKEFHVHSIFANHKHILF